MVRVRHILRFIFVVLVITALYAGPERLWISLAPLALSFFDASSETAWQRESVSVAKASARTDERLPAQWRLSAYLLGFELGFCSNMMGSVAFEAPSKRVGVSQALASSIKAAEDLARELGVGPAALFPVATVDEFMRLKDRMEADELGLASRIEAASSRRHRHLFMLGMHVGAAASVAESTSGNVHNPAHDYIGRHATLAGVPAAAWKPVAGVPDGTNPASRLMAYRAALAALEQTISQLGLMPVDSNTS